jgi:hypothetical protein
MTPLDHNPMFWGIPINASWIGPALLLALAGVARLWLWLCDRWVGKEPEVESKCDFTSEGM